MARRMSCSLTTDAVRERRKTVTRRHVHTWTDLRPGDQLTLIEKGMGLPKGAKQVILAEVEVVAVDVVSLLHISLEEVAREGCAHMSPQEFIVMWLKSHGYRPVTTFRWSNPHRFDPLDAAEVQCRRIEWRYLDRP